MVRWLLLLMLVAVVSCTLPNKRQKAIDHYYDINGLIDQQIKLLDSIGPSLLKTAIIDGQKDVQEIIPNDSTWKYELDIFRSLDLNKPTLLDSYALSTDSTETKKMAIWTSKYPEETAVDTLKIIANINQMPLQVYAVISSQNTLFKTNKKLELVFRINKNTAVLQHYAIAGWQKMVSKDTTTYQIDAEIKY